MVRRRHVYHIAGYDPMGAGWYRVFKRELATFTRTWNVSAEVSDLAPPMEASNPHWTVATRASNWHAETMYEPMLWDDIVLADFSRPVGRRLARSASAFLDIVTTGAALRYFKANWQYALFFLFPYFLLLVLAVAAFAIAHGVASAFALATLPHVALVAALGAGTFALLLRWPGRRWRMHQGLDDWIFSWDYVYGRRQDMDARLDRFAGMLAARAREPNLDEIVIVGHSMGATLALEVVTRALALDPDLGRHGPAVCLLTVGSTIPKFTLHPAGERFRNQAARIVQEPAVDWAEYHARSDAISFYKFDPVTLARFYGDPNRGKPHMRRVWLQDMLTPRTYWRFRLRFMRLHYQFVMANERRSTYDYFMMVCGPIRFGRITRAPAGPVELIAADGALIDQAEGPADNPQAAGVAAAGPSLHDAQAR